MATCHLYKTTLRCSTHTKPAGVQGESPSQAPPPETLDDHVNEEQRDLPLTKNPLKTNPPNKILRRIDLDQTTSYNPYHPSTATLLHLPSTNFPNEHLLSQTTKPKPFVRAASLPINKTPTHTIHSRPLNFSKTIRHITMQLATPTNHHRDPNSGDLRSKHFFARIPIRPYTPSAPPNLTNHSRTNQPKPHRQG